MSQWRVPEEDVEAVLSHEIRTANHYDHFSDYSTRAVALHTQCPEYLTFLNEHLVAPVGESPHRREGRQHG